MSDEHNSAELIQSALDSLKDFQRATVDVVYDNLFRKGQQRMLVADEVGLGKTIVAKGVIARRIRDRLVGGGELPLKVTYICSNQENLGTPKVICAAGDFLYDGRLSYRIRLSAYLKLKQVSM